LFMLLCVPPTIPTQYIFHTAMARYSLYVLKVQFNTKRTNKQTSDYITCFAVNFEGYV